MATKYFCWAAVQAGEERESGYWPNIAGHWKILIDEDSYPPFPASHHQGGVGQIHWHSSSALADLLWWKKQFKRKTFFFLFLTCTFIYVHQEPSDTRQQCGHIIYKTLLDEVGLITCSLLIPSWMIAMHYAANVPRSSLDNQTTFSVNPYRFDSDPNCRSRKPGIHMCSSYKFWTGGELFPWSVE